MKKKKTSFRSRAASMFASIVSLLVVVVLLLNLLWPDRAASMVENRPLAQFPRLSWSSLQDGSFGSAVDDWFADQFVGRDSLFHLHYLVDKTAGVREIDDVYLGKGALLQQSPAIDEALISEKAQAINAFAAAYPLNVQVAIAPTAEFIDQDRLPAFVQAVDQGAAAASLTRQLDPSITSLDVITPIQQDAAQYLYYRTDHHWTSLGAWHAASVILSAAGESVSLEDYEQLQVSRDFQGTLQSKTGSLLLKDDIDIYPALNNPHYLVTYNNDGQAQTTIYDDEALRRKDQYEVFFGGNDALVQIQTTSESERHLLIFKDSYANSVIQFLLPYYRSITMVDPRYYYDNISRLIESSMITDVLFLYNYSSFMEDRSLLDVLESAVQLENQSENEQNA